MAEHSRTAARLVGAGLLLATLLVASTPTSTAATCSAGVGLFFNDSASGDSCECHFSGGTVADWIIVEVVLRRQAGSPYECSATSRAA